MNASFAELANVATPMGVLSLRRRREPMRKVDVYEVKLGDEFLMSSLFTAGEVALAKLGLDMLDRTALDVVVGGLGLGYTARAVLEDPRVESLLVVEALSHVIDWHTNGLLPETHALVGDSRCHIVCDDFFGMVRGDEALWPEAPGQQVDAILVDIDHTPSHLLNASHTDFYTPQGMERLARDLRPGGVFGLWSDALPDEEFLDILGTVFVDVRAEVVAFPNFYTGGESSNTVYLGRRRDEYQ